jgi:hypothetical protein
MNAQNIPANGNYIIVTPFCVPTLARLQTNIGNFLSQKLTFFISIKLPDF